MIWHSCWLSLLVFAMGSSSASAVSPSTIETNNEGILAYDKEDYYGSYQKFAETLAAEPFHPLIHLNIGMTYYINEEPEKAIFSFTTALEMAGRESNEEHLFYALFNTAAALSTAGKIDEALALYQKALSLQPGDKNVRENIEKIWQAQQGGGKGGSDDQKDKKPPDQDDQEGQGQQNQDQQDPNQGKEQKKKKKPKPFESKELSKDDVRKILEEIKNQEQKIRADMYEGKAKDSPKAKDW